MALSTGLLSPVCCCASTSSTMRDGLPHLATCITFHITKAIHYDMCICRYDIRVWLDCSATFSLISGSNKGKLRRAFADRNAGQPCLLLMCMHLLNTAGRPPNIAPLQAFTCIAVCLLRGRHASTCLACNPGSVVQCDSEHGTEDCMRYVQMVSVRKAGLPPIGFTCCWSLMSSSQACNVGPTSASCSTSDRHVQCECRACGAAR